MRQRARSFMRRLHLWLGLGLGAPFVLLGLTGSVLVFYPQIDALLHPEIRPAIASAPAAPDWRAPVWDTALATVRRTWPDKTGPWRFEVTGQPGPIPARYYAPAETAGHAFAPMMVWLSPDGRHVLRRDFWGSYAMTFIYDLHMHLLAERTGAAIVGYGGIGILLLLVTGVWAWWPRGSWRKALAFKRRAVPTRRLRDLHKLAGLWSLPVLVVLVGTGVMLGLPDESDRVLGALAGPVDPVPVVVSGQNGGRQIPVAAALARAHAALPAARLAWIEVPGHGNGVFRLRMQQPGDPSYRFPHSFVMVDQYTGQVRAVVDARRAGVATTINNWLHPLHDASVGGLGARVLAVVAGLFPLALFVTGLRRWSRRRQQPGHR